MNLEEQFSEAIKEWRIHLNKPSIQVSSSSRHFIDCEAYRNIRSMGKKAIPFIRQLYNEEGNNWYWDKETMRMHGFPHMLREILGEEFQIPVNIQGRMHEIENYTRNWLDQNADKYIGDRK